MHHGLRLPQPSRYSLFACDSFRDGSEAVSGVFG
ncbi:hypothetical protein CGMCC3_g6290 [Colletotrichum fructicola]|nr:uncharacterized protein CGMCC3_g6290 [Colletotrichum fructicola]KAE9577865.1 hypothetical protein CGMCC3_g6290 [Colletotrichum fructicola]